MTRQPVDYKYYDPTDYAVQDVARLVVHANIWADCRGVQRHFNKAVNSKLAWGAISEWVDGFNRSVGTPLFSSTIALADNQPVGFIATGFDI